MTDLPTDGATPANRLPAISLLEAVGYGPDSEVMAPLEVNLLGLDAHTGTIAYLRPAPDGSPVYSCERWLRLRVLSDFVRMSKLRFWIDNYSPNPGWDVFYGTSATYAKPQAQKSYYAVTPVLTADPGEDAPNLEAGTVGEYSNWLVLQARWSGEGTNVCQAEEFNYDFAWSNS